jgi:hypothetical protein
MIIDPSNPTTPAVGQPATRGTSRISARQAGDTDIRRATEVNRALNETPAVRPEAVARARKLVGNVKYPPDEIINSISKILSTRLDPGDQVSPTKES